MNRAACPRMSLVVLATLVFLPGCEIKLEEDISGHLPVTGTVTYQGKPVLQGQIHFLPVEPRTPPASGTIRDGAIKDVFTRQPGDGVKSGRYRIAITTYDDAFQKSVAKRDYTGPDPEEVARAANQVKKLIPVRYNNARDSGLSADLSPSHYTLRLELVD